MTYANALIDVDTLWSRLASVPDSTETGSGSWTDPERVVLDVRWSLADGPGHDRYQQGHLPAARFVDLDRELAGPPGSQGRHPLPTEQTFTAAMRAAGVSTDSDVVVYDDGDGWAAARAWWTLRYFGHDRVRVLDGGHQAWVSAGGPVTRAVEAHVPPGDFTARAGGMPVVDADGAAQLATTGVLLDARAGERYRGEVEPIDRVGGHIPGALSAPTHDNAGPDGRLRDPDWLRTRFAGLGVDETTAVGCYCGSGVSAAHQVLALHQAGYRAALYVGSWSQWSADPSRPVATGAQPGGR